MQNLASKSRKSKTGVSEAVRRASIKLGDGDIKGAVRVLCSEDDYIPPNMAAFNILLEKHLPQPPDRRSVPPSVVPPLFVGLDEVLAAVRTFSPGLSGRVDGLRPQHLIDMLDLANPGSLRDALVDFVNSVLAGGIPPQVRPFFC